MSDWKQPADKNIILALAVSFVLTALFYFLQADIGLKIGDEGFLWYGTMATASGKIPFRDFQSYDPGRYYWTAAWSFILGDGLMALRLSVAIFQGIGLFFGLLAVRRVVSSWWGLFLAGLLLILWMHPRHKLFESSIVMMAVFFFGLAYRKSLL